VFCNGDFGRAENGFVILRKRGSITWTIFMAGIRALNTASVSLL